MVLKPLARQCQTMYNKTMDYLGGLVHGFKTMSKALIAHGFKPIWAMRKALLKHVQ